MKLFKANDMTELHTKLGDWFMEAKRKEFDFASNSDCALSHVIAVADHMNFDWDVKDLWLTRMRWNALTKQYLDPIDVQNFLAMCTKVGKSGRGVAMLRTKVVLPRGGSGLSTPTRKWGSCMMSISYAAKPTPTVTLHSRTSYIGYLGAMDMNVAWNLARYIAREVKIKDMANIKFMWHCELMQWHFFKSMAYLLNHPDPETKEFYRWLLPADDTDVDDEIRADYLDRHTGACVVDGGHQWLRKILDKDNQGISYGDERYNTYRRVRRRYHREILGYDYSNQFSGWYYPLSHAKVQKPTFYKPYPELPSVMTSTLDLAPIKLPYADWRLGKEFIDFVDEGEDDDGDDED